MKKNVIAALALSLLLMAGVASASTIGIFGDVDATTCSLDVPMYMNTNIHYAALLDDIGMMSACEFGATGVAFPPFQAAIGINWSTTLAIGDIRTEEGIALAFNPPLEAPLAYLGYISYLFFSLDFPVPDDHVMSIVPSGVGTLVVVDADTGAEVPAQGWSFVMNCTPGGPFGNCECEDTIATEDAAWGQIKALY